MIGLNENTTKLAQDLKCQLSPTWFNEQSLCNATALYYNLSETEVLNYRNKLLQYLAEYSQWHKREMLYWISRPIWAWGVEIV